jgi:hypothetical protein
VLAVLLGVPAPDARVLRCCLRGYRASLTANHCSFLQNQAMIMMLTTLQTTTACAWRSRAEPL